MLPLAARSLLALACAALLHAACADYYPTECNTDKQGTFYGLKIELPLIEIPTSLGPVVNFEIPDNCQHQNPRLVLQGEVAKACDYNAKPDVIIYDHLKKVQVTRNNFNYGEPDATLQVTQYCE